jgi:serine/threonine protein kinase
MEYIEGETLQAKKLKGGLQDEQSIFAVMTQLLDAVETVHNANMLHRDIKPENVLIANDNKVVLIDFGSARDYEEAKTLTHSTILTPGYAPIEQYSNRAKRGAFTDIYALGATLYFLLTGQKPLAATDRYREQLPSPQQLNPAISTQLSSAVMMAMAMEPEDRFQTVADLRAALLLSGKKVEKPVVTEILPVTELPKPEKTLVQRPAIEEKPVKKSDALIYGGIIAFVFILLAFLVLGRGEKTTELTYCDCYASLYARIENQKIDSIKLRIYNNGVKECDQIEKDTKPCNTVGYLEQLMVKVKNEEENKLKNLSTADNPIHFSNNERCGEVITYMVTNEDANWTSIFEKFREECNALKLFDLIAANGGSDKIKAGDNFKFICKCKEKSKGLVDENGSEEASKSGTNLNNNNDNNNTIPNNVDVKSGKGTQESKLNLEFWALVKGGNSKKDSYRAILEKYKNINSPIITYLKDICKNSDNFKKFTDIDVIVRQTANSLNDIKLE